MPTILLIDDHAGVRELLAHAIRSDGHTVITAENGQDGLAQFWASPYDLVITDMHMPVMGGPDLIAAIHHTKPHTPNIGMSGGLSSDHTEQARTHLGIHAFFSKPLELHALRHCIDSIFQTAEPPHASAASPS